MAAVLYSAYTLSWGGQEHLDLHLHLQVFSQQTKEQQKCACLRLLMHREVRQRSPRGDATADFRRSLRARTTCSRGGVAVCEHVLTLILLTWSIG
jgi:hypothetical protein